METIAQRGAMKAITQWIPRILTILVAVIFTGMYFATSLPRLVYPYDLDFLEDSVLMESLRFAQGQPVYIAPNADFNPHVYMPLFFWLGGILFKLGGPGLPLLRSISFAATLGTTIMVYGIAKRESGLTWIAVACTGLFLGGYRISGFWYELARVDSLFLALTLCGLALAIYGTDSIRQLILSAFVLALAAFTKQTGAVVGAALALYLLISIGRRAVWFALTFGILLLIPLIVLNINTDGWFFYHIFHIGSADPIEFSRLIDYLTDKIFGVMAVLSLMTILTMALGVRRSGLKMIIEQPWLIAIGIAILISGMGRIRVGGNLNNLMPAYALLCLAPAILIRESTLHTFFKTTGTKEFDLPLQNWLIALLILTQFSLETYSPARYIPTTAMRKGGDQLVRQIAAIQGPVLVMMHPYYTLLAGKDPSTQLATLWYVRGRGAQPFPHDFVSRIQEQYYSAIISDESFFETQSDLQILINTYYFPAETLNSSQAASTNTGVVVRPKTIYLPYQHQDAQLPDQTTIQIKLHHLYLSPFPYAMPFQGGVN